MSTEFVERELANLSCTVQGELDALRRDIRNIQAGVARSSGGVIVPHRHGFQREAPTRSEFDALAERIRTSEANMANLANLVQRMIEIMEVGFDDLANSRPEVA